MEKVTFKYLDFDDERFVTIYGLTESINLVLGAVSEKYIPVGIYRKPVDTKEKEST